MADFVQLNSRPVFFDASALVKLVLTEPGSEKANRIKSWAPWVDTSWICIAEVLGCLKRKWNAKELSDNAYSGHVYAFLSLMRDGAIHAVDVGRESSSQFGQCALLVPDIELPLKLKDLDYEVDAADAIQLLIIRKHWAHRALVQDQKLCFVSADRHLLQAAITEGIQTVSVITDLPDPVYDTCTKSP